MTGEARYCFRGLSHEHSVDVVQRMWRMTMHNKMTGSRLAEQEGGLDQLSDYVGSFKTKHVDVLADARVLSTLLDRMPGSAAYALTSAVVSAVSVDVRSTVLRELREALRAGDDSGTIAFVYGVLADCVEQHERQMAAFDQALR